MWLLQRRRLRQKLQQPLQLLRRFINTHSTHYTEAQKKQNEHTAKRRHRHRQREREGENEEIQCQQSGTIQRAVIVRAVCRAIWSNQPERKHACLPMRSYLKWEYMGTCVMQHINVPAAARCSASLASFASSACRRPLARSASAFRRACSLLCAFSSSFASFAAAVAASSSAFAASSFSAACLIASASSASARDAAWHHTNKEVLQLNAC